MQDYSEKGKNIKINKELAKIYISQLRELAEETGITADIDVIDISKFPEVLNISNQDNEEILVNSYIDEKLEKAPKEVYEIAVKRLEDVING